MRTTACLLAAALPFCAAAGSSAPLRPMTRLPLAFEANVGQAGKSVQFVARVQGGIAALSPRLLTITVPNSTQPGQAPDVVRVSLTGASGGQMRGERALAAKVNYLVGRDPRAWRRSAPMYQQVRARNVYPGIDLLHYGNAGRLRYDFTVRPGADPARIDMTVGGVRSVRVAANGNLEIGTAQGSLTWARPVAYQVVNGRRTTVNARFAVKPGREPRVGFRLARYDATRPLVIDPTLISCVKVGGAYMISSVKANAAGELYVAGTTWAAGMGTSGAYRNTRVGYFDGFVMKVNAAGNETLWCTYLGGTKLDEVKSLDLDPSGNLYVCGMTQSTDFPTVNPVVATLGNFYSGFAAKLTPDGSGLAWSTYFCGSDNWNNATYANCIAADTGGRAYVVGFTAAHDFPTANAEQRTMPNVWGQGFLCRLDPVGGLDYSTFVGGSTGAEALAVAVDSSGSAYVTGACQTGLTTTAGAFRTSPGSDVDAFVSKYAPDGRSLVYSTFLGGDATETGAAIAVDGPGAAYVTGYTWSPDFPTVTPIQGFTSAVSSSPCAFVSKLSPDGSALAYSTFLGGAMSQEGKAIAVDGSGSAIVTGVTSSTDFPVLGAYQSTWPGGGWAGFISQFTPAGDALAWSTYLVGTSPYGGNDYVNGVALVPGGIAVGGDGSYLLPVTDLPIGNGVAETGFVAIFASPTTPTEMSVTDSSGSLGAAVQLSATLTAGGVPLPDRRVLFTIDWQSVRGVTDAGGVATATLTIAAAVTKRLNTITAIYGGDFTYQGSTATGTLTVGQIQSRVWAPDRSAPIGGLTYLRGYLWFTNSAQGLEGRRIRYRIDGVFAGDAYTNAAGQATLNYTMPTNLALRSVPLKVEYFGDEVTAAANYTAQISGLKAQSNIWVLSRTMSVGESQYLRAYVRRATDWTWLAGLTISFALDGTPVGSAPTDAVGMAYVLYKVPAGMASGDHPIACAFGGDGAYLESTGTGTLTVR